MGLIQTMCANESFRVEGSWSQIAVAFETRRGDSSYWLANMTNQSAYYTGRNVTSPPFEHEDTGKKTDRPNIPTAILYLVLAPRYLIVLI